MPEILEHKTDWKYSDFDLLPPELRCEVIDGELLMSPAPFRNHQYILGELGTELKLINRKFKLGEIYYSPFDVVLEEKNVVQPDILFVKNENKDIFTKKGATGVPDILIEILSQGQIRHDRIRKMELYHRFKVPEYWIVDPANKTVEVYEWKEKKYELFSFAEESGDFASRVQPEFALKAAVIFPKDE